MKSAARWRIVLLLVLIAVALASSLWGVLRTGDWEGLALNFGTEMAGAVVTYVLLELIIGHREEQEAKKADLIAQLSSKVKDVTIAAAEELRRYGWLYDGSLQGANLRGTNLSGADLQGANLQGANLLSAHLQGAFLLGANLRGAILFGAKLQEAALWSTNLRRAVLVQANLQGANLRGADLQGAFLFGANLRGANLAGANLHGADLVGANLPEQLTGYRNGTETKFDEKITLPDGTEWTPDTDMTRFTDSTHPAFWHSDKLYS